MDHPKIVAVYRHPLAAAQSSQRCWWNDRYSFEQTLTAWTEANKSLLYFLANYDHILVRFEDLVDPDAYKKLVPKLASFCGVEPNKEVLGVPEKKFTHSQKEVAFLKENYPLPVETQRVVEKLDNVRVHV